MRLRHQAVIGGDNQHDDVGDIRASRAHGRESGMTGRVEESDLACLCNRPVGADVLRDSAGFARRDARLANRIHQRSLAVIDMAHERDNRAARLEFFFLLDDRRRRRDNDLLYLVNAAAFLAAFFFQNKSVSLRNLRRDIGLDRLVRVRENIEVIHQLFDQLEIFQTELRRQILHNDRRLDMMTFFGSSSTGGATFRRLSIS